MLNFIHIDKTHAEHCKCYLRHDPQMITILFAVLFVLIIRFGRRYRAILTRAYFSIAFDNFINHHRCSCGFSSCTYLIHDVWTCSIELSMNSHTFIPTIPRASTDTACHAFLIVSVHPDAWCQVSTYYADNTISLFSNNIQLFWFAITNPLVVECHVDPSYSLFMQYMHL